MVLPQLRLLAHVVPIFDKAAELALLKLQLSKCVLVPVWTLVNASVESQIRAMLLEIAPTWGAMKIASLAKYLGAMLGPGVTDAHIWKEAVGKWWRRVLELPATSAPPSI